MGITDEIALEKTGETTACSFYDAVIDALSALGSGLVAGSMKLVE